MKCLKAFDFNTTLRSGFVVLLLVALALVGCTNKLLITSEPSGATVTVTDPGGKLLASGASPLLAELTFSEKSDKTYTVEVFPTTDQAERFLPGIQTIDTAGYLALDEAADQSRTLAFELTEKDYVPVPVVEVILTPQGRWVGVLGKSRSFKDVTEAGGAIPTLIVDFGENRGIQGLAISPDGDRIVYSEAVYANPISAPDAATLSVEDQRVYNLKGANLRGINIVGGGVQHITTEDFQDMFPSFSADGERIYFSSNRRGESLGILGIRANGRSGISDIYVDHRNGMVLQPTAAGDGTIAFCVINLDPVRRVVTDTQVWTHYGPNEFPTQITRGRNPAISPEGEHIAYINPEDGNLWVIDPDGSNRIQLTSGAASIMRRFRAALTPPERMLFDANRSADLDRVLPFSNPTWTPDGRYILYTSMEGTDPTGRPNEDIWMMKADGSEKQQLTTNGSSDRFALMSPDGDEIYFLSNRGESWAIWRMPFVDVE